MTTAPRAPRAIDTFIDDAFWDEIVQDSERRLAAPLGFALEALSDLFAEESDKERGFVRFERKLQGALWWADDAVQCLERVLAEPPSDLGRRIREDAGVRLWNRTPAATTPADDDAHVAWLRAVVPRLRTRFDAFVAERLAAAQAEAGAQD